jgi:hypothetical protein
MSSKYTFKKKTISKHKQSLVPLYPKNFLITGHGFVDATIGEYNKLPQRITLYTRVRIGECANVKDDYSIVRDKEIGWKGRKKFHDGDVELFTDFASRNKDFLNVFLSGIYDYNVALTRLLGMRGEPFLTLHHTNDEGEFMITKEQAYTLYDKAVHPNRIWIDRIFGTNNIMSVSNFKKNPIINMKISRLIQLHSINRKRRHTNIYLSTCREVLDPRKIKALNDESDNVVFNAESYVNEDDEHVEDENNDYSSVEEDIKDDEHDSNEEWFGYGEHVDSDDDKMKKHSGGRKTNKKRRKGTRRKKTNKKRR